MSDDRVRTEGRGRFGEVGMTMLLRRRVPVIRRMRFMRYAASKDLPPAKEISFNRSGRTKRPIGLHLRWDMRCYSWVWRTVK